MKAWQGLASFQGESSFATWIYRLTTNVCIDWLRRQKRREGVEPSVSLDDEESGWAEPADRDSDPHLLLERSERGKALARGLDRLPDWQRRALVLRELSGLSYQEIGQALDIDLGTVKSRIARARLNLRKILLEDGNFFDRPPSKPPRSGSWRDIWPPARTAGQWERSCLRSKRLSLSWKRLAPPPRASPGA